MQYSEKVITMFNFFFPELALKSLVVCNKQLKSSIFTKLQRYIYEGFILFNKIYVFEYFLSFKKRM